MWGCPSEKRLSMATYIILNVHFSPSSSFTEKKVSFSSRKNLFIFSKVWIGRIFKLVESIGAMLRSISRLVCQTGGINKDPIVWPDGGRQTPKNVFKNKIIRRTQKFDQLGPNIFWKTCIKPSMEKKSKFDPWQLFHDLALIPFC
jgi:hypothetical protein